MKTCYRHLEYNTENFCNIVILYKHLRSFALPKNHPKMWGDFLNLKRNYINYPNNIIYFLTLYYYFYTAICLKYYHHGLNIFRINFHAPSCIIIRNSICKKQCIRKSSPKSQIKSMSVISNVI